MRGWRCWLLCALLCAACGGGGGRPATLNLRPGNSPDVVLLSVSGHGGALSAVLCTSGSNRSYLADPGDAVEALEDLFVSLGLTVQTGHFADLFMADDMDGDGIPDDPDRLGFLQLVGIMQAVFEEWIDGFDNPTRIVIVAHSHGATWAHIATSVMDHVPVDYLVTLDGICLLWPCEHDATVDAWIAQNGNPYPWDISQPCDAWAVMGQAGMFNTKDVVFDNVGINLEVQSSDLLIADGTDNFRLDGTQMGIFIFDSPDSHAGVHAAGSASMTWVTDMIRTIETAP